ncbi:hypothetical protein FA95DRAFT_1235464 [Auriscalpium vulgare]|uniref:Uncharacterized protein n=1 Tax=Auriscalpium vulgare TaxID=40419 RepID=A0ACB8S8Y9_9AGAM|nr:hypothetical protein FA95DRAFT_1235464 [Auriscalpium vulgare]
MYRLRASRAWQSSQIPWTLGCQSNDGGGQLQVCFAVHLGAGAWRQVAAGGNGSLRHCRLGRRRPPRASSAQQEPTPPWVPGALASSSFLRHTLGHSQMHLCLAAHCLPVDGGIGGTTCTHSIRCLLCGARLAVGASGFWFYTTHSTSNPLIIQGAAYYP